MATRNQKIQAAREAYEAAQRAAQVVYESVQRPALAACIEARRVAEEAYEAIERPALEAYEAAVSLTREAYEAAQLALMDEPSVNDCPSCAVLRARVAELEQELQDSEGREG